MAETVRADQQGHEQDLTQAYTPAAEVVRHFDTLMGSVVRHDLFSADHDDEFRILRENGFEQGIFKVWSPYILPKLDRPFDTDAETHYRWQADVAPKPLSLHQSLEQWRSFSEVADRRLQHIFAGRELSEDPEEAIPELFMRMYTAFAFAAPFYTVEALTVDSREDRDGNPIDLDEVNVAGGQLDAVAMLLPSAFAEHVTSDAGDWNGLDWDQIHARVGSLRADFADQIHASTAREDHPYALLMKIANLAHVDPEDVLYAANQLQHIPVDVGGKRGDLPQDEALAALHTVLSEEPAISSGMVAKNTNALIRFLNWCPTIRSGDNFAEKPRQLSYGAVCNTVDDLAERIEKHPHVAFRPEFTDVYEENLKEQLENLDAESAKGRFFLQLLMEGKFTPEIERVINQRASGFIEEVMTDMQAYAAAESVIDIHQKSPTYSIGGKAEGLRRAAQLYGPERIVHGQVITSEAVSSWLMSIPTMVDLVEALERSEDTAVKVAIGQQITEAIQSHSTPFASAPHLSNAFSDVEAIVLRSSAYDEDVDIIGPAPGVYESVVGVNPRDINAIDQALKEVVSSFFSDKAISFRDFKGLRHKPIFAVIVQEMIDGVGGSVFVKDGHIHLNIASSASQVNELGNTSDVEEHEVEPGATDQAPSSSLLKEQHIKQIIRLARTAELVGGPSDLEYALDRDDEIKLLQLRSLERPPSVHPDHDDGVVPTDIEIRNLEEEMPDITGLQAVNLVLDSSINLEKFQGPFLRWSVGHKGKVRSITVKHKIPATCHAANIIQSFGIKLIIEDQ